MKERKEEEEDMKKPKETSQQRKSKQKKNVAKSEARGHASRKEMTVEREKAEKDRVAEEATWKK